jgi:hypothetical protein
MKDNKELIAALDRVAYSSQSLAQVLSAHATFMDDWLERYRAIMMPPPAEPTPYDDKKWKKWPGGFPPVSEDTMVWVKQEDGRISHAKASDVQWRHYQGANIIVAWQPGTVTPAQ